MGLEWKPQIIQMVLVKQQLANADKDKLFPWHLPNVAADDRQIHLAEKAVGLALSSDYKDFLHLANGWRGFLQSVDLFGTVELSGNEKMVRALELLTHLDREGTLQASNLSRATLFPIAVSSDGIDVFLMTATNCRQSGHVIWFAGYEIDRYKSFSDYFEAMIDANLKVVQLLKS